MFYRIVAYRLSRPRAGSAVLSGSGTIAVLLGLNFMALQIVYNHYTGRALLGGPTGLDYALMVGVLFITYSLASRFWVDNGHWGELVREFGSEDPTRRRRNSIALWCYFIASWLAPYLLAFWLR
jgi:hypothetical protein